MIFRSHRAVTGALLAGALTLPVLTAALAAPPKKPAKPAAAKADPKKGKDAFKSEGCASCHKTKDFQDPNASVGPDLSEIAKDHTAAQISKAITAPKAGSVMPAFKGPKPILDNMVAYMMTQK